VIFFKVLIFAPKTSFSPCLCYLSLINHLLKNVEVKTTNNNYLSSTFSANVDGFVSECSLFHFVFSCLYCLGSM
jgi:hypothetical protein